MMEHFGLVLTILSFPTELCIFVESLTKIYGKELALYMDNGKASLQQVFLQKSFLLLRCLKTLTTVSKSIKNQLYLYNSTKNKKMIKEKAKIIYSLWFRKIKQ